MPKGEVEEKRVDPPFRPDMRVNAALAFFAITVLLGIDAFGFWLLSTKDLNQAASNVVSGFIMSSITLITIILQFYFRKKPDENRNTPQNTT